MTRWNGPIAPRPTLRRRPARPVLGTGPGARPARERRRVQRDTRARETQEWPTGDSMETARLVRFLRGHFALDWSGIHGSPHWDARARERATPGASDRRGRARRRALRVPARHCREHDGGDPEHGRRAATFARHPRGELFELDDAALELPCEACEHHSGGRTRADPTVMTCWDADRLDLGRVGTRPLPRFLCTDAAREPERIAWAYGRSLGKPGKGRRRRRWRSTNGGCGVSDGLGLMLTYEHVETIW